MSHLLLAQLLQLLLQLLHLLLCFLQLFLLLLLGCYELLFVLDLCHGKCTGCGTTHVALQLQDSKAAHTRRPTNREGPKNNSPGLLTHAFKGSQHSRGCSIAPHVLRSGPPHTPEALL